MHVPTTANHITGIDQAHYHKILIFFPTTSLKCLRAARIDQLADSNEPAIICGPVKSERSSRRMKMVLNADYHSVHQINLQILLQDAI